MNEQLKHYFSADGTCLTIPANVRLEQPIVLRFPTSQQQTHIIMAANSKAIFIALDPNQTQIFIHLKNNACLSYSILQQQTKHLTIKVIQDVNSQLNSQILGFGGKTNYISFQASLVGVNASCNINALEYTKDFDTHTLDIQVEHAKPNSTSHTVIRSVLDHNSSCLMNGTILVTKNSSQVKANLQHKTILLSEQAKIASKPQLEIYNDDVVCSHGSSIGTLAASALLYMNSRGISLLEAQQLLLQSFIAPIITAIPCPSIQQHIQQLLFPEAQSCNL